MEQEGRRIGGKFVRSSSEMATVFASGVDAVIAVDRRLSSLQLSVCHHCCHLLSSQGGQCTEGEVEDPDAEQNGREEIQESEDHRY